MAEGKLDERVAALEDRLRKMAPDKKDGWDIFNIVASLLVPASIAFSGYYFSSAMKDAEIESARELAARQESIAIVNARVGQADLVGSFIDPLTSDDEQKRRIAIKGILIALPDEGPGIVETIAATDDLLQERTAQVEQLLGVVVANGPQTAGHVGKVQSRLGRAPQDGG